MGLFSTQSTGLLLGLNEDENPKALAKGELSAVDNVYRRGSLVGTRPGLQRPGSGEDYETQLPDNEPIQGMVEYRKDYDEGRQLLVIAEDSATMKVFYNDAQFVPAGPTIATGQDNIWTFALHNNLLWAAGGGDDDDLWSWDGDTGNAPIALVLNNSAAARVRPKYVFAYRGFLLMNGMRGGLVADDNPAVTRYCTFGDDTLDASKWLAGNTVGFGSKRIGLHYGADFTTGFASYRDSQGDWLIILADKALYSVQLDDTDDFMITDAIGNGCVNQRAFVSLGIDSGDAIYMSRFGIHSLRQSQAFGTKENKFLSWKIRSTFGTLNRARVDKSIGVYDPQNGFVVFAVSTGSNTAHDTLLVLDTKSNDTFTAENAIWYIWHVQGVNINSMLYARDASGNYHIYVGTLTGDVLRFDHDVFKDINTSYTASFVTRHDDYGSSLARKTLGPVMITLVPGGDQKPNMVFHFDYGTRTSAARSLSMKKAATSLLGTGLLGSFILGEGEVVRDERVDGRGSGRTIAFGVSHSGADEPFWVGKIDHMVASQGTEEGDAS